MPPESSGPHNKRQKTGLACLPTSLCHALRGGATGSNPKSSAIASLSLPHQHCLGAVPYLSFLASAGATMPHSQDGLQLDKQPASRGSLSVESLHQRVRCESSYVISFPSWTPVPRSAESQVSIAPKFAFASHIRRETAVYRQKNVQSVQSMQPVQLSQSEYCF
jgi:hypothetical protein